MLNFIHNYKPAILLAASLLLPTSGCEEGALAPDCHQNRASALADELPAPPGTGLYHVQGGLETVGADCPGAGAFRFTDSFILESSESGWEATFPLMAFDGGEGIIGGCENTYSAYGIYGLTCIGRSDGVYQPAPDVDAAYPVEFVLNIEFDPYQYTDCGQLGAFIGSLEATAVGVCAGADCDEDPGLGACMMDGVLAGMHEDLALP